MMKNETIEASSVTSEKKVFQEALNFLKNKVVMTSEEYKKIKRKYKALAFSVSGYESIVILDGFMKELQEALEQGTTKEKFRENMNRFLEDNGYTGMSPHKSDNIFRTNIQTAFNVGHYKSMSSETNMQLRPFWQYQTAGDGKTRANHLEMEGKVYYANDPIWNIWFPPNGFKCRCTVVSLSRKEVERKGLRIEDSIPMTIKQETGEYIPVFPDKSFNCNPAKIEWKPDLSSYPKKLRKLYLEREKENK